MLGCHTVALNRVWPISKAGIRGLPSECRAWALLNNYKIIIIRAVPSEDYKPNQTKETGDFFFLATASNMWSHLVIGL